MTICDAHYFIDSDQTRHSLLDLPDNGLPDPTTDFIQMHIYNCTESLISDVEVRLYETLGSVSADAAVCAAHYDCSVIGVDEKATAMLKMPGPPRYHWQIAKIVFQFEREGRKHQETAVDIGWIDMIDLMFHLDQPNYR